MGNIIKIFIMIILSFSFQVIYGSSNKQICQIERHATHWRFPPSRTDKKVLTLPECTTKETNIDFYRIAQ